MAQLDRRTKQKALAMALSICTGALTSLHVAHTLKLDNWDPSSVLWVQALIAIVVPAVMIAVLYWLIDRLGRSH